MIRPFAGCWDLHNFLRSPPPSIAVSLTNALTRDYSSSYFPSKGHHGRRKKTQSIFNPLKMTLAGYLDDCRHWETVVKVHFFPPREHLPCSSSPFSFFTEKTNTTTPWKTLALERGSPLPSRFRTWWRPLKAARMAGTHSQSFFFFLPSFLPTIYPQNGKCEI